MGTSKTPMQPAPSLRASTSMAVHPSIGACTGPPPSFTKYAKIQPAIAIKPKPQTPSPAVKSAFNPRYDPSASSLTLLQEEAINTLRKWILPPRPRPGRKPTSAPVPEERKPACKKKFKTRPATNPNAGATALSVMSPAPATPAALAPGVSSGAPTIRSPALVVAAAAATPTTAGTVLPPVAKSPDNLETPPPGTGVQIASSRLESDELSHTFLARLKEQELIRNYIEVLTNQIKELRFVQSGVISVDALDSSSRALRKIAVPQTVEQLDQINNIRDLDRFVAHLTTQLNVIHSVTKKVSTPAGMQVQMQIRHYLDLRAKHRAERERTSAAGPSGTVLTPESLVGPLLLPLPAIAPSSFTPSLLRPLRMNLFEEDDIIDVDILNDDLLLDGEKSVSHKLKNEEDSLGKHNEIREEQYKDGLSHNMGTIKNEIKDATLKDSLNETTRSNAKHDMKNETKSSDINANGIKDETKLRLSLRRDPLALSKENLCLFGQDILAERIKLEDGGMSDFLAVGEPKERRLRKMVCGFCNTETPCLCFDADSIFGDQ